MRTLTLPVPVLGLAFCGSRFLCVVHRHEYVLVSIASGSVRELFRFDASYGAPFLRRLSPAELLLVQPPPRAGVRRSADRTDRAGACRRATARIARDRRARPRDPWRGRSCALESLSPARRSGSSAC